MHDLSSMSPPLFPHFFEVAVPLIRIFAMHGFALGRRRLPALEKHYYYYQALESQIRRKTVCDFMVLVVGGKAVGSKRKRRGVEGTVR